jgi:MoxR-like ATPase
MEKKEKLDEIISPDELKKAGDLASKLQQQLDAILLGRPELHRMVLVGILSQGHILLEGVPGTGRDDI